MFAWLIADGDMQLKNLALLKIAEPGDPAFRSARRVTRTRDTGKTVADMLEICRERIRSFG